MKFEKLTGLIAVITGGTRGIGYAIAKRFKEEGAIVIITGQTIRNINEFHGMDYHCVNFLAREEVEYFKQFLKQKKPDILINNAGINNIKPFCEYESEDFEKIHRVNLEIPFQLCQSVLEGMREKNGVEL